MIKMKDRRSIIALMLVIVIGSTGAGISSAATPASASNVVASALELESPASEDAPAVPESERDAVLGDGWQHSDDFAWSLQADARGLNVMRAKAATGYAWELLAALPNHEIPADQWIGNSCLTQDGKTLAVVYAPRLFTNDPTLFGRGAFASIVDVNTGQQTYLGQGYSLAYFNPGCGSSDQIVLSQYSDDSLKTRLTILSAQHPGEVSTVEVDAQVTSATTDDAGILAASGSDLVRISDEGLTSRLASGAGTVYDVTSSPTGVGFVTHDGDSASIHHASTASAERTKQSVVIATGSIDSLGLARDIDGETYVLGAQRLEAKLPDDWTSLPLDESARLSARATSAVLDFRVDLEGDPDGRVGLEVDLQIIDSSRDITLKGEVPQSFGEADAPDEVSPQPSRPQALHNSGVATSATASFGPGSPTQPFETERTCAVARNDPASQALQPLPRQVEWAVNQAVTNNLTVTRPTNWMNLGMPAYSPQGMFPQSPLVGGGRVPAQVMLGVLAQESNLWQASRYTTPGVTGNPLIGNFYGQSYTVTGDAWWEVDFGGADCGYGVAQVTDGMRLAGRDAGYAPALPATQQRAIALDYAANIAKGLDMLADKWNETTLAGVSINDGDPQYIENWFAAVWAYNSGFYGPTEGTQQAWGLGWFNNPINPYWDPSRSSFLNFSPSDAANPQDWPYSEKVLGFAAHSVELPESATSNVMGFRTAWWTSSDNQGGVVNRETVKPPIDLFCVPAVNDCDPEASQQSMYPGEEPGPCLHQNSLGDYDLRCYFHGNATWKDCDAQCGREFIRFAAGMPEEASGTSFPPICSQAGLPAGALVVDNLPNATPVVRPGCGTPAASSGTFSFQFGSDGAGEYPSKIDMHQLGAGFNGHFNFTHARTDDDLISGELAVTGTWTLNQSLDAWTRVMVHMPDHGAWSQQAAYTINTGANGSQTRTLAQRNGANQWLSLGVFEIDGVPQISLSNTTHSSALSSLDDIAWDAVAFVPLAAKPTDFVVALGDSYSSGEGASAAGGADYYRSSDNNGPRNGGTNVFNNACHRSTQAWSRKAFLPGDPNTPVGQRADTFRADTDYHLLACSGAVVSNITSNVQRTNGQFGELGQIDKGYLDDNTTLVTLSVGGNDIGFADIISTCVTQSQCRHVVASGGSQTLEEVTTSKINTSLPSSLSTLLQEIHAAAPNAEIALVGYPPIFAQGGNCAFVPDLNSAWLNDVAADLNSSLATIVSSAGSHVTFTDPTPYFADRNVCSAVPAVHGFVLELTPGDRPLITGEWGIPYNIASQQSFHPNNAGTDLYASALSAQLAGVAPVPIEATLVGNAPVTYFATFRYHVNGPASFAMSTLPGCGSEVRVGLRKHDGTAVIGQQHTETISWTKKALKNFKWTGGGYADYWLPTGLYAFNGRLVGGCSPGTPETWKGTLRW
jgi:hypothetical protein